jgi:hypothetical protein
LAGYAVFASTMVLFGCDVNLLSRAPRAQFRCKLAVESAASHSLKIYSRLPSQNVHVVIFPLSPDPGMNSHEVL